MREEKLRRIAQELRRFADELDALAGPPQPRQRDNILRNDGYMLDWMTQLYERKAATGKNNSDIARDVFGEMRDPRGYLVARNRDRIGTYFKGTSYPKRATMLKLCASLGIDPATVRVPPC